MAERRSGTQRLHRLAKPKRETMRQHAKRIITPAGIAAAFVFLLFPWPFAFSPILAIACLLLAIWVMIAFD